MPASKKVGAKKGAFRNAAVSGAKRANITIPPARVMKLLRRDRIAQRMGKSASVYLAAVMDYMASEIIDMSVEQMNMVKKKRITPRNLKLAIANDQELSKMFAGGIFAQAGVMVQIHPVLDKKKKGGSSGNETQNNIDPSQEV